MPDTYFDRVVVISQQKESNRARSYGNKLRLKDEYQGDYKDDMKQGNGKLSWSNGETYEGQFNKDYPHGRGIYSWPDGSTFKGRFYLGKKQGYGKMTFANGDSFHGLYKKGERAGPGVYRYAQSNKEDIGIWHRKHLIQLCTSLDDIFTIDDHPEYVFNPEDHISFINMEEEEDNDFAKLASLNSSEVFFATRGFRSAVLIEENTLPSGIEKYSEDFEHLPLTEQYKKNFDMAFFQDEYNLVKNDSDALIVANNNTPLLMAMQKNTYKHRHQLTNEDHVLTLVPTACRDDFESMKGQMEAMSESLIYGSSTGDGKAVYSALKSDLVNPNVCDRNGITALFAAAINSHKQIVNLLLDMGANVDHLTNEGLSALTACHVFYYPIDHFKKNIAESYVAEHKDKLTEKLRFLSRQKPKNKKKTEVSTRRKALSHPAAFKGFVSPTTKERRSVSPKHRNRRKSPRSVSSARTDISKLEDIRDMDQSDAVDYCKSDLKIKALHREISLSRCGSRSQKNESDFAANFSQADDLEIKSMQSDKSLSEFEIESSHISDISHKNIIEYDMIVPEELIEHTATLLSFNKRAVSGVSTRDGRAISLGTTGALAVWKAEHKELCDMIKHLLVRGADTNISQIPLPPLFFAVKAADTEFVRCLLESGADTAVRLSSQYGGFTALHIASAIPGEEGVECVDLLLKAGANPNITADDQEIITSECVAKANQSTSSGQSMAATEVGVSQWITEGLRVVEESGRTPLHIACDRDDDYKHACKVVHLLLDAGANPDVIWSGHSPLSLAIKSGNDCAIEELIRFDADISLPLHRGVGSALCAASCPLYEDRRTPENRLKLINRLIETGANILAPIVFGSKQLTGSVVDYAHWMFSRDLRIAHTPYHALTYQERDTYNARKALLAHLGMLIRNAALKVERVRLQREKNYGIRTISPSRGTRFLFTGAGATPSLVTRGTARESNPALDTGGSHVSFNTASMKDDGQSLKQQPSFVNGTPAPPEIGDQKQPVKGRKGTGLIRKPLFRYCYECGRSVGVRLTACSRCHEVYYCSRSCKLRAWDDRHKKECMRMKTIYEPISPTSSELASYFTPRTVKETISATPRKDDIIETRKRIKSSKTAFLPDIESNYSPSTHANRIKSSKSAKTASDASKSTWHRRAHVNRTMKSKLGKNITFGTTGMTLKEMGIKENYTFI